MKTQCEQIDELLMDYLYRELEERREAEVATHVQNCPRCAREVSQLSRTRQLFSALEAPAPPAEVGTGLLAEAARQVAGPGPKRATGTLGRGGIACRTLSRLRSLLPTLALNPAFAAAVTILVVLGVSFYVYKRGGHELAGPPSGVDPRAELREEGVLPPGPPSVAIREKAGAGGDDGRREPQPRRPTTSAGEAEPAESRSRQELATRRQEGNLAEERDSGESGAMARQEMRHGGRRQPRRAPRTAAPEIGERRKRAAPSRDTSAVRRSKKGLAQPFPGGSATTPSDRLAGSLKQEGTPQGKGRRRRRARAPSVSGEALSKELSMRDSAGEERPLRADRRSAPARPAEASEADEGRSRSRPSPSRRASGDKESIDRATKRARARRDLAEARRLAAAGACDRALQACRSAVATDSRLALSAEVALRPCARTLAGREAYATLRRRAALQRRARAARRTTPPATKEGAPEKGSDAN